MAKVKNKEAFKHRLKKRGLFNNLKARPSGACPAIAASSFPTTSC